MSDLNGLADLLYEPDGLGRQAAWDELRRRITVLNARAWEDRVNWGLVQEWLNNFDGSSGVSVEDEKFHALYLLSQFLYFGSNEIRVLLRSVYRDLFLIPLIQELRRDNHETRDPALLASLTSDALNKTRFLGVGNPSESGVHLLYYFRQENNLSKNHFLDTAQIFERTKAPDGTHARVLRHTDVNRYVFIDDVCGSGHTAIQYSIDFLEELREKAPDASFFYFSMFSSVEGMNAVRTQSIFGQNASAIFELDNTYRCLSPSSRYLTVVPPQIDPNTVRTVALYYGERLLPGHAGGYEDGQMLLGFHHNTPDNTLPVIWMDPTHGGGIPWTAVFRRYPKI